MPLSLVTLRAVTVVASDLVVTPTPVLLALPTVVAPSTREERSPTKTPVSRSQSLPLPPSGPLTAFPDFATDGNASTSGDAQGGDADDGIDASDDDFTFKKRATDDRTAGGDAYTGSSGDAGSGNIINSADDDATVTNTGPETSEYSMDFSMTKTMLTPSLRLWRRCWHFYHR